MNCCGKTLCWQNIAGVNYDNKLESAYCPDCRTTYVHKNKHTYLQKGGGEESFRCLACQNEVLPFEVLHPIHVSGMRDGGTGKTYKEVILFCPNCEPEPSSVGSTLYEN